MERLCSGALLRRLACARLHRMALRNVLQCSSVGTWAGLAAAAGRRMGGGAWRVSIRSSLLLSLTFVRSPVAWRTPARLGLVPGEQQLGGAER